MAKAVARAKPTMPAAATSPAVAFAASLAEMARDPSLDATKLEAIFRVQRELLADQARELFNAAFVRMRPRLPQINRDGTVTLKSREGRLLGSYKFARWEDMDAVITPILAEFGFALSFHMTLYNGLHPVVVGELIHEGGHVRNSQFPLTPDAGPGRNELQAQGSGMSYAMRYLATLLLSLARKGADTDGVGAGQKISQEHLDELLALLAATKTDPDNFRQMMITGIDALEDIPESEFPRLKNALLARQRRQTQ